MPKNEEYKQLVQAQVSIADSLKGIQENLKQLNDLNILHTQATKDEHQSILNTLKTMTEKYWWLIIVMIAALLAIAGYKEIASLLVK